MSGYAYVAGARLERSAKHAHMLPVGKTSYGAELALPLNVIVGAAQGPRLVMIFCQHGDETSPLAGWYRLFHELDPAKISGEIVAVPVANPAAYEFKARNSWVDALHGDHGNLNRAWPGQKDGWYAERLAHAITSQLLGEATCVIDFHDGTAGGLDICYGYLHKELEGPFGDRMRELSIAFGMNLLIGRSLPYRGTLSQYLTQQQVLNIGVEIGYFYGFDGPMDRPERTPEETVVTGVTNVMRALGMLPGAPSLPERQMIVEPETRLKPPTGGLLVPRVPSRAIGRRFAREDVLYDLIDLATMQVIDSVHGLYEENVLLSMPREPVVVNPGDQGCHVADAGTIEWIRHGRLEESGASAWPVSASSSDLGRPAGADPAATRGDQGLA